MSEQLKGGGPAFPVASTIYPNGEVQHGFDGMTLRDYFAAKALQGLVTNGNIPTSHELVSEVAFQYADAMLAERNKKA